MTTLTQLLASIRSRPGIVLGRKSAESLEAFLRGFAFARQEQGKTEDYQILSGFDEWVHERFRIRTSQGWAKIIAFYSNDQSEELTLFWKLFDEYMKKPANNGQSRRRGEKVKQSA